MIHFENGSSLFCTQASGNADKLTIDKKSIDNAYLLSNLTCRGSFAFDNQLTVDNKQLTMSPVNSTFFPWYSTSPFFQYSKRPV